MWFMKAEEEPSPLPLPCPRAGGADAPGVGTNLGPRRGLGEPPGRWWWYWWCPPPPPPVDDVAVLPPPPPPPPSPAVLLVVLFSLPKGNLLGERARLDTLLVTPATTCCSELKKLIFASQMVPPQPTHTGMSTTRELLLIPHHLPILSASSPLLSSSPPLLYTQSIFASTLLCYDYYFQCCS